MTFLRAIAVVSLSLVFGAGAARAQVNRPIAELENLEIQDKVGTQLPLDVQLTDHTGAAIKVGDYFDGKLPTIVVMAYYSCPMLCTLVLNGVTKTLRELAFSVGTDFRVLVVSIDPRDTTSLALQKRSNYLATYGRQIGARGWDFALGTEAEVRRLAAALGFRYRWDEEGKQYAHAAAAFVVTPQGVLSRTLYGITFSKRDLNLGLVEASEGRLGTTIDKLTLFCFHYDPLKKSYVMVARRVMSLGGLLTMLILGSWLIFLWRRHAPTGGAGVTPNPQTTEQSV